jgi:hypothetical protein
VVSWFRGSGKKSHSLPVQPTCVAAGICTFILFGVITTHIYCSPSELAVWAECSAFPTSPCVSPERISFFFDQIEFLVDKA